VTVLMREEAVDWDDLVGSKLRQASTTASGKPFASLRLRRTLDRNKSRDVFTPPERREAERAVAELDALVEAGR
jgi:hypothetical protein